TELYHLRDRLAAARGRLVEATQGVEHLRMVAARSRTGFAEDCLTRAMEAHSFAAGWAVPRADLVLKAAQLVVVVCLVWPVTAVVAHLTGGSVPWMAFSAVAGY